MDGRVQGAQPNEPPMRIAQIAPLAESVPPKLYGGTERVVHWLTEELVRQGHEVTLFASGDSRTSATLAPVIPRALRLGRPHQDPAAAFAALLADLSERAEDFDVIHSHVDWLHLPILRQKGVPYLTTLHGRIDLPGLDRVLQRFPDAPFISISDNQRSPLPNLRWLGTVYHGMPEGDLRPLFEPGSYLAFLGRLAPEKGAHVAIDMAKRAGLPLRIAAKVPRSQSRYVKEQILPHVDDNLVRLIGEVDDRHKATFLANASALLFPIKWPEPFGLVMIEAMACGTPVIAFRKGSVPEVIQHGTTGFVVDSDTEAVEALKNIGELDRRRIRRAFEERFSAKRMADDYLRQYMALMGGRASVAKSAPDVTADAIQLTPDYAHAEAVGP
jgi:glycosyltransferase involved in cell wall biosynthesis